MKGQRPINNQVVMDHYFSILRGAPTLQEYSHLSYVLRSKYVFGIAFMYSYFLELFRPLTKWVTAVVVLVSKPLHSTTKHAVWHKYFKAYYTESLRHQRI